jgi:2'-hydroxyisoflavone reductase
MDDGMRILIIGGTVFLGRHLVEATLARGHEVTLFNRGRSNIRLFAGVERLRGDRDRDVTALEGRRWHAVIDTCGYTPSAVRKPIEVLAGDHYTFISSVSVYEEQPLAGVDEKAPVKRLTVEELKEAEGIAVEDGAKALGYGRFYGPLKVLCEEAAEEAMPGRVLEVRPGLIVGPHDYSDRFTWWVRRVA